MTPPARSFLSPVAQWSGSCLVNILDWAPLAPPLPRTLKIDIALITTQWHSVVNTHATNWKIVTGFPNVLRSNIIIFFLEQNVGLFLQVTRVGKIKTETCSHTKNYSNTPLSLYNCRKCVGAERSIWLR